MEPATTYDLVFLGLQMFIVFASVWTLLLTAIFVAQFRPGGGN